MVRASLVVALFACAGDDKPPAPPVAAAPARAPAPSPQEQQEPTRPRDMADTPDDPGPPPAAAAPVPRRESWFIENLSADGKRVLLRETNGGGLRFRVVAVDTNTIEKDVSFPHLSALPIETLTDGGKPRKDVALALPPELATELPQVATLLKDFPFGSGDRIAAAPDGKHVAFMAGDWLFSAADGKVIKQLSREATYHPWFAGDGSTLFYHRYTGTFDGVEGRYELFATSVDGRAAAKKLAGTAGLRETFALTPQGTVRFVVSAEPKVKPCVVEVGLAKPYAVKKLGCLKELNKGRERTMGCVLSPTGKFFACNSSRELDEIDPNSTTTSRGVTRPNKKLAFRTRVLEVDTGKQTFDGDPKASLSAVSDEGLLVLLGRGDTIKTVDVAGKERTVPTRGGYISLFTHFRNATELVIEQSGNIAVIDVTK